MKLRDRKPLLFALLALALGLVTAAVAIAGTRSSRGHARHVRSAAAPNRVDPEIKSAVGVFRRERVASDAVDTGGSSGTMARENGIALDESRRLPAGRGTDAWVVPSAAGVCVLVGDDGAAAPGGSCFDKDQVLSGDVIVTLHGGGSHEALGLVPDGVETATLHYADGSDRGLDIESNSYYSKGSRSFRNVTFRGPGGPASVSAGG